MRFLSFIFILFLLSFNASILLIRSFFAAINDADDYALMIFDYVMSKDVKIEFLKRNELEHLNDVRVLINRVFLIRDVCLVALVFSFSYFYTSKRTHEFVEIIKDGFLLFIAFIAAIFVFALLSFDRFLILFHQIFFPRGNWAFPANSMLIALFPKEFWLKQTMIFLAISFFEFIVFYAFYILNMKKQRCKRLQTKAG